MGTCYLSRNRMMFLLMDTLTAKPERIGYLFHPVEPRAKNHGRRSYVLQPQTLDAV